MEGEYKLYYENRQLCIYNYKNNNLERKI